MASKETPPCYEHEAADGAALGIDPSEPRAVVPSRAVGHDPVERLADLVSELSVAHGGVLALLELLIAGVEDLQRAHDAQAAQIEELHGRVDEFIAISAHRNGGADGHRALRAEAAQARRHAQAIRTRAASSSGKASELLCESRGMLDAVGPESRPGVDGSSPE